MNNRVEYQSIGKQNGINVTYGTILEGDAPKVIIIRCKGKIKPIVPKKSYENDIDSLKEYINYKILSIVRGSKTFSDECLTNVDVSSRSIKYNKYSFIKYDVYVKPLSEKRIQLHSSDISELTSSINLSIVERLGDDFKIKMD